MEFTLAKSSMNKTMPFFHPAINLTKLNLKMNLCPGDNGKWKKFNDKILNNISCSEKYLPGLELLPSILC